MSPDSRQLAYYLDGASQQDDDFYVMINAHWEDAQFRSRSSNRANGNWSSTRPARAPLISANRAKRRPVMGPSYTVRARSIVVLLRPRRPA